MSTFDDADDSKIHSFDEEHIIRNKMSLFVEKHSFNSTKWSNGAHLSKILRSQDIKLTAGLKSISTGSSASPRYFSDDDKEDISLGLKFNHEAMLLSIEV